MASYQEIREIWGDTSSDGLKAQVDVAIIIAAEGKLSNVASTLEEQRWASGVLANPESEAKKALMAVIASNNGATIEQILSASDSVVQTQVNAVVPGLVIAFNG